VNITYLVEFSPSSRGKPAAMLVPRVVTMSSRPGFGFTLQTHGNQSINARLIKFSTDISEIKLNEICF